MEKKRSPLGVLFLTLFIDLVGFSIIFPLFPAMLDHYLVHESAGSAVQRLAGFLESLAGGEGETRALYTKVLFGGFLGSLYSTLQFLFSPVWGALSDRYGRRPILLYSIAGLALSYLLWIVSGSFMLLIASRLLGGCMSGNISTASAAVADSTSRENRAKGMGIIGAAFGLGFIFGPAIGGLSATLNPLEWDASLASWGINPFSIPALVAFLLALANLVWVATRFEETTTPEQREQARARRRPIHPLMAAGRTDIPGVARANLTYFLFLVAFAGVEFTLSFFAREAFGYDSHDLAWIFVFAGLVIAFVQGGLVRRLAPKLGEKRLALTGLAALVPGFFVISLSPQFTAAPQVAMYLGVGFMAVGSAFAIPCLTSLVSLYTPMDRQGAVLGVFRSLGALSRAVGPIIFCMIYWKFGREWPYFMGAALLLVPIALAVGLPQPAKGDETDGAADAPTAGAE